MRLSLIAVAMCLAWLAGAPSAEARSHYGYKGNHYDRADAKWTGKRRYAGRHLSQGRRYTHRQYSYRTYAYRGGESHHRTAYRKGVHRHYAQRSYGSRTFASAGGSGVGPRPRAWCGWWMRTQLGGGPEYNLAANWRNYGRPSPPQVGAVVVWPHHVGIITGQASNGKWIVKSGNDGGRVRERAQSIAGAVFRMG